MSNNDGMANNRYRMKFHGKGGEYFSIWFVNALLTAITLGIYSAWATVRRRRYFYGNTELAGDRFDYLAQPMQILKGRLLVAGGLILFFVFSLFSPLLSVLMLLIFLGMIPWIVVRSWRYNAIMSSYRGVRFNYHCQMGKAYWVMFFCPLMMFVLFYAALIALAFLATQSGGSGGAIFVGLLLIVLFIPGLAAMQGIISAMHTDLYINNLFFGDSAFKAVIKKAAFIKFSLISLLILLPFLIAMALMMGSFIASLSMGAAYGMSEEAAAMMVLGNMGAILLSYVLLLIGVLVAMSYQVVAQRNYLFRQTTLNEDRIKFHSSMSTLPYLGLMLTNTLMVVFSLGLAIPVAEVRHARYIAEATEVEGDLALLNVHAHKDSANVAVAEEIAQAFDLGAGL
ncbi:YjgN family protein [Enterobacillus tribolii]|uniref:Uncharacterized membrane protein YjgN (DUF898 family) n=1 Tax=Enterobacillus tribolii TaxID=1487935 RepID=A0A370QGL2_9GAMM|nr:DUF898 family protein [Enterobacillus tribolii]MBW7981756.1 DUF898 domain-containing protein [Enterobacillus tribolii]RDK87439.1 uncharacterized membrane protein YjgN (DUF898 family) [Enterobacillus tribolii]